MNKKRIQKAVFFLFCSWLVWQGVGMLLPAELELSCDAETIGTRYRQPYFMAGDFALNRGEWQSDLMAHSGQYSLLLHNGRQFGMDTELCEVKGGESASVSVWRYNPNGVASGTVVLTTTGFWQSATEVVAQENGWEKIELQTTIPAESRNHMLKVYCYQPGPDSVFFDDLEVRVGK